MKNFNILGVHVKLRILRWGGGGHVKPIYRGGITLMGVTWTACRFQISDLMGGRGRGVLLRGGWHPNAHYVVPEIQIKYFILFYKLFLAKNYFAKKVNLQEKPLQDNRVRVLPAQPQASVVSAKS